MLKKIILLKCLLFLPFLFFSQTIKVLSFNENPLEINPLTGGNLTINYTYSSETDATSNHIYIGLEILDSSNSYIKTVAEITLENQTSGANITGTTSFFLSSNNLLTSDLKANQYYQIKTILYKSNSWIEIASSGYWNTPKTILQDSSGIQLTDYKIAKGADISWMTEMENAGFTWKDSKGTSKELLPLLSEYQIDAIRLRVWVDPKNSDANGWCNIADLVYKAKLAKALNMDIMLSVHYSDFWADPGKQNKPTSWINKTITELETAIYNHTTAILTALKNENITPKWMQIGNETSDGMLWPEGKASTTGFVNYAKFINAGNKAVKDFNTTIKTIIHISNGNDNTLLKWNIGGLITHGAQFYIIAMSLYPDENNWQKYVDDTYSNMIDLTTRYNKEIIIAEVGFNANSTEIAHQFLVYMIEKTKQAKGLGVFYWEPMAHNNWKSYNKGAWNNNGSPSIAMNAFIDKSTLSLADKKNNSSKRDILLYPNPTKGNLNILVNNNKIKTITIFDTSGKELKKFTSVKNQQKINISFLPSGIYLLTTNTKKSYKIIR